MSAVRDLADEIRRPQQTAPVVTAYRGVLVGVDVTGPNADTVDEARVNVNGDVWQVTALSGPFVAEVLASDSSLVGRAVRVFVVGSQPEIAYTL